MTHPLTFPRGGIALPSRGQESRRVPIVNADLPSAAFVPLPGRGRNAVVCLVRTGDRVTEGQLIGRPGFAGAPPVHAPIPGTVAAVREIDLHDGTRSRAAVIELGGAFAQSGRPRSRRDWSGLPRDEILDLVRESGVALEPSREPLAEMLAAARDRSPQVLIANAVETQPWLAAGFRLLADRPADVAEGLRIAQAVLGSRRVVLAVDENAGTAVDPVAAAFARAGASLEISVFGSRYPQEDEAQLAAALLGRTRPPAGSALEQGAVVIGLASLAALYDAVVLGRPCYERVLTLAGPALQAPRNLKVRFGTRAGELVEEAGGLRARPAAVVFGSPMQGHAMPGDGTWEDVPITREVPAVLFLGRGDVAGGRVRPCLRCGRCLEACPWGLVPVRLHELAGSGALAEAAAEGLAACTACGCCSYTCPSLIPLAAGLRQARASMAGGAA